jgi:four helix bundle protein
MSDYKQLLVWQRAIDFSVRLHEVAKSFPRTGAPGLKSQLLRAVGSIHTNLSERSNSGDAEYARFVTISIGSTNETENHVIFAMRIGFIDRSTANELIAELQEIRRMLYGLRNYLQGDG